MKRPRVLYLVPDLFGPPSGIALYCRMVCLALSQSQHKFSVISLLDNPSARRQARAALPHAQYVPCAGSRAAFVHRALRAAVKRPNIILVGHPNLAPLGRLLARLSGAKLVCFIYGIDAWQPLSTSRKKALAGSDLILSISRFTARRAAEVNGVPQEKVRILHNCLDPQLQTDSQALAASTCSASPSLLTVARISLSESYKGHDVVIRALPALLSEFPNLIYNIVGGGDGRPALEALAREVGGEGAVRFHGVVSDEDLARHYSQSWVFAMPSRFEGFGFVFLEAMAHGKPVIAGNEDASVEVVRDGETGFTVMPTSTCEVAQAITRLLRDEDLRQRMGTRGAEVVATEFGFERFRETLLKYLQNDLEGASR